MLCLVCLRASQREVAKEKEKGAEYCISVSSQIQKSMEQMRNKKLKNAVYNTSVKWALSQSSQYWRVLLQHKIYPHKLNYYVWKAPLTITEGTVMG